MKARVPERAMVPIFSSASAMLMPIPLSEMVRVPAVLSGISLIFQSVFPSRSSMLEWDSNLTLSMASEALDMSSRRKMSLLE